VADAAVSARAWLAVDLAVLLLVAWLAAG